MIDPAPLSSEVSRCGKSVAVFLCNRPESLQSVWGPAQRRRLDELVEIIASPTSMESLGEIPRKDEVEVIFSTWSMPKIEEDQWALLPNLRAVFYAAGSVKYFAPPLLDRGVTVVSAWAANAIPVAEFSLAQILFSLKLGWQHVQQLRAKPSREGWSRLSVPGAYESTVGIISLGMIGRKLCELLRPFGLRKLAYDPFVSSSMFQNYGLTEASLSEIFAESDVVTLHAPWLRETEGMITGEMIASMKPNATFLNTARGALVREAEMISVLQARPDITAVLDSTYPEPPEAGSPLYTLPNVVLTPHIAGSSGNEVRRMADFMIEEFQAWRAGRPLRYEVTAELLAKMA
jgi:phosphoglycerate dehydrogenase-like enzyme